FSFFFFQAEDGIRDGHVTGVQTCALPIFRSLAVREVTLSMWWRVLRRELLVGLCLGLLLGSIGCARILLWQAVGLKDYGHAFPRSEERRVGKECKCRGAPCA